MDKEKQYSSKVIRKLGEIILKVTQNNDQKKTENKEKDCKKVLMTSRGCQMW